MKYFNLIFLLLLVSSCCSTKQIVNNTPKETINTVSNPIEIFINTFAKNYSPLEVEEKITIPLESILKSIDDVKEINSVSNEEYSKIKLIFNANISTEFALKTVENKVNTFIANNGFPKVDTQSINPKISSYNNFDEIEAITISETVSETEDTPINNDVVMEIAEPISSETATINKEVFNHHTWDNLLKKHVSENGNVAYQAIKNNPTELRVYIDALGKNMPTENWTKEDKLAYWINAYNAMTIDLIIRNYPIQSIKDIKDPWEQRLWKLGKKWYNLDEIEHQILRKMNEPRIHFGIVCASFSCPKLQNEAFEAWQLEDQLTAATEEFLSDSKRNNISSNHIKLSKIFQWFSKDFKQSGSLIDFLNKYSDTQISSKAKKSFKSYNWDLND